MSCPDKYKKLGTFYKYYTGEVKAPVLTLFIGGNHEASNYSQELYGHPSPFGSLLLISGLMVVGLLTIYFIWVMQM